MAEHRLRQQTNSQAQAGAAAQLIVNIFLVTTDGTHWTVKPIAFHVDRDAVLNRGTPGAGDRYPVDVDVEAEHRSNAQGQGLTVINDVSLTDILRQAVEAAARDRDIQAALNPEGGGG